MIRDDLIKALEAKAVSENLLMQAIGAFNAKIKALEKTHIELMEEKIKLLTNLKEAKKIIEHDAELLETLKKQVHERQAEANSYRDLYNELRSALNAKHTDSRTQVLKIAEELKANKKLLRGWIVRADQFGANASRLNAEKRKLKQLLLDSICDGSDAQEILYKYDRWLKQRRKKNKKKGGE
jgi:hypothetical protein